MILDFWEFGLTKMYFIQILSKGLKKVIKDLFTTIKFKKATIVQLKYIYNNIIISKVEYLHKVTILSEFQCKKTRKISHQMPQKPFRSTFIINDN